MAPTPSSQTLPPSVEEAYRRKCALLKQRMADVEETNDAARVRLARLKRQVEKQRLERAFLLEQLAKRTSANVQDSDGSPSPPPTPKEKPLRTKRGHRKASLTGEPGSASAALLGLNAQAHSPNSDAASNNVDSQAQDKGKEADSKSIKAKDDDADRDASDAAKKRPGNGFELYCAEERPRLAEKKRQDKAGDDVDMADAPEEAADASSSIEAELARGWKEMPQSDKDAVEARAAEALAKHKKDKEQKKDKETGKDDAKAVDAPKPVKEEDTEMADDATPSASKE